MTIDEGKELVRKYMQKIANPSKPNIWIGDPYDVDELGFNIEASIYADGEDPEAAAFTLLLDFKSGEVDLNLIG